MSNLTKGLLIVAVMFLSGGLTAAQLSPSSQSPLTGVVTSAGKPVEGVVVSARADGKTFTTSVFTDSNGAYAFPRLEDGRYAIWAQAVGFEAAQAESVLSGGKKIQQNFALKALRDFSKQLSGDEWVASLPGNTPQDLRMKSIFTNNCTGCHPASFTLPNRFDARGWAAIVNFMVRTDGWASVQDPEGPGQPMMQAYKEELVGYLTKVRGPNSAALNIKPVPRPAGDAARVVITEFDVPPGLQPDYIRRHNGSTWSEGTPSRNSAGTPHDAVVDQQGIVWFTDQLNAERTIGRLDPKTGQATGYKLAGSEGMSCHAHGITVDASGTVFFNCEDDGILAKFDPKTEQFTKFPRSELPRVGGNVVEMDSKGFAWAPTNEGAIKLDPKSGIYTAYKQATPGGTYGLTVDKEDQAWVAQPGLNLVMVVDTAGKVSEVRLPPLPGDLSNDKDRQLASTQRSSAFFGTPAVKVPRRLAGDPNGDYVWVTEYTVDQLARINIRTKEVKEYPLPHRYSQPYAVAVDKNHMVWIALMNTDRIAKFNPFTEQFTEYTLPTHGTEARHIAVDNTTDPPSVWIPYYRTNKLARVQFQASANTR